ncbi:UDP-glucuronosyltransferase 2B9-like [Hyposmocoma kahamanoa]|uniref:UDP-glucuronosyltransferase 2B9-like n=1 Tax=Hyposmocoma kahamanoa TaxID=1477025 RepID=UPI000E6D9FCF|nr:UDP-glucuronosyltransferase 2B9-like [Hyposmocoma kahamanoa]
MAKTVLMILLTIILGLDFGAAYKILVVFPFPSSSHGILGDGFVRHLLGAGHEVTYITPFVKDKPHPNLRQIDVKAEKKHFPNVLNITEILNNKTPLQDINFIFGMMLNLSRNILHNENVQRLIDDPSQHFDLVIGEWMFSTAYCGFGVVFDCPCIVFFPAEFHQVALSIIDEPPNPAYTRSVQLRRALPFSFKDRVMSLFLQAVTLFTTAFKFEPAESVVYESAFSRVMTKKGKSLPTFDEMKSNIALILYNSHVSMGSNVRSPLNYVPIGGYHIDTEGKPLPEDLQKIMDESKNGVIYFSMGSNLQSKDIPDEIKKNLLNMFGGLKQTVLWKFEEQLPNRPKNVHILKWAPQQSILAHSNCILFITHGGLLSSTEAVHFGVPIIGIPTFADQFTNIETAVQRGFAKKVDLSYSMAEDLKVAIEDILKDPK